jgi:hypothetical protein
MSEYKFMQSDATRDLIVVKVADSKGNHFKGVCVTNCRSIYIEYTIGDVREDWFTDAFTEITPQEAKDKYCLVLFRYMMNNSDVVCCQMAPITNEGQMPVVAISDYWKAGGLWNLSDHCNCVPLHQEPPKSKVDWSEAPVWAEAYGQGTDGLFFWLGKDTYRQVGTKRTFDYGDEFERDEYDFKIIEKRPPRTIAQILGISSLSADSEIAKNQKTVITTPKPTKTQRVINRAFEDIFTTTVTFKNPEWGALLFETIEPRLTYEQKLDLVCAVYGVYDEGESDEEHF